LSAFEPLRDPVIGFAHRGARAHAPENTLEAFVLARKLGANGLESDVWLTADGEPVLVHDEVVGSRLRRRRVGTLPRGALPPHIPGLDQLFERCGTDYELSLDLKHPGAIDAVVATARNAGAAERLWLCHPDLTHLAEWRPRFPDVHLVHSTRLHAMRSGPERHAASLAAAGVDVVNLPHADWTAGLTTLFHRFKILAFGWDAQFERIIESLRAMGIDGIYSDHVDRLVATLRPTP
jgi:glycerophosphoryl diester phosphodiesterase